MLRQLWAALLVLVGIGMLNRSAGAEDLPTVAQLRANIAAASGPEPGSSYERIVYTRSGAAGSETIVRSGDDVREGDSFGPLAFAHGSFQKQAWHQNANGQTVLDQPDPGAAAADSFTTTVQRVTAPVDAFVIAQLNSSGSGTREYVDPISGRVVRREEIRPTETTVYVYDDFRTVDGYTLSWHWTVRDGHSENDADYRIEAFVARPVDAAEVAIPAPRRALVEFPPGRTSVDLPVRLVRDKFIVRVTIGGRGLDLELDSGASSIVLDSRVVHELGLRESARYSNAANAGRVRESYAVVPNVAVGDLRMRDVVVRALPLARDEANDVKMVGLLGFDFIAELGLRLDYEHGRVSASTGDLAVDLHAPGSIALDVRLGGQQPSTTVVINGATAERFVIDTGGAGSLMIADYFARRYPRALVDLGGGDARNARFYGVGGPIDVQPYQLAKVTLGNVTFTNFVAYRVMQRASYEGNQDGLIGANLLRLFTVWLDYADSRIYLVPNADGRRAMR